MVKFTLYYAIYSDWLARRSPPSVEILLIRQMNQNKRDSNLRVYITLTNTHKCVRARRALSMYLFYVSPSIITQNWTVSYRLHLDFLV